jgi:hypothetical protein
MMRREIAQREAYYESDEYINEVTADFQKIIEQVLPAEILERAAAENWDLAKINDIIEKRKEKGYETIKGFHTSDIEINGQELNGDVFYTTNLSNLYGKKAKWLYIIDGANDDQIVDEQLGWRRTNGHPRKILAKIRLNDKVAEKLGASFADVEYH